MADGKKAVFLDLDGTLYPYEPCHRHGLRAAHSVYRRAVAKLSRKAFDAHYRRARETVHRRLRGQAASHSRLLYFQTLLESDAGRTGLGNSLLLEQAYWEDFLRRMKLFPWVRPFLRRCRGHGQSAVVVTNLTAEIQMRKLVQLRMEGQIDFLVTSEEAGAEKPAPAIFYLALRKAQCRPREVLVVGNDPRLDRCPFLDYARV